MLFYYVILSYPQHAMSTAPNTPTSLTQSIFRILLGATLLFTGTGHMTFSRQEFVAQVPDWLPLSDDAVVLLSGVAELALGLALIFIKRYRVQVGWATALFFVAVFPGNISQYVNHIDAFGLDTDSKRLVRLFFQPVLVAWALWSTGAWSAWRKSRA
jgi:uncharacterized membrane protein